jgi:heterodisulfide reductase subunit A-like polyferredoxin
LEGKTIIVRETTWEFKVPPPSIPESDIKEKVIIDIVVEGAGNAGLMATASAVQMGAKTVLLQKLPNLHSF